MKSFRLIALCLLLASTAIPSLRALEKQPTGAYRMRRVALAAKMHGGVAVLFAAEEPLLDFMPYRQDSDFYYFTGWTEPGAALLVVERVRSRTHRRLQGNPLPAHPQSPHGKVHRHQARCRHPGVTETTGVDAVKPMTDLPAASTRSIDRRPQPGLQHLDPANRSPGKRARRLHRGNTRDDGGRHPRCHHPDRPAAHGERRGRTRLLGKASEPRSPASL